MEYCEMKYGHRVKASQCDLLSFGTFETAKFDMRIYLRIKRAAE